MNYIEQKTNTENNKKSTFDRINEKLESTSQKKKLPLFFKSCPLLFAEIKCYTAVNMIQWIMFWCDKSTYKSIPKNSFYTSSREICHDLQITSSQFLTARRKLYELGLIDYYTKKINGINKIIIQFNEEIFSSLFFNDEISDVDVDVDVDVEQNESNSKIQKSILKSSEINFPLYTLNKNIKKTTTSYNSIKNNTKIKLKDFKPSEELILKIHREFNIPIHFLKNEENIKEFIDYRLSRTLNDDDEMDQNFLDYAYKKDMLRKWKYFQNKNGNNEIINQGKLTTKQQNKLAVVFALRDIENTDW